MHIRNTGESFPRLFPRLQRDRRHRRGALHSDVKRRTFTTCSSSPLQQPTHGLLPPAAATPVSNTPACWRPSSRLHRYRGTSTTPPVASSPLTPFLHVTPVAFLLRCGLPADPAAGRSKSQAQSRRRPSPTVRSSKSFGATPRALRPCSRLYTSPAFPPGIFLTTFSTALERAICCSSNPSSSPSSQPRSFL